MPQESTMKIMLLASLLSFALLAPSTCAEGEGGALLREKNKEIYDSSHDDRHKLQDKQVLILDDYDRDLRPGSWTNEAIFDLEGYFVCGIEVTRSLFTFTEYLILADKDYYGLTSLQLTFCRVDAWYDERQKMAVGGNPSSDSSGVIMCPPGQYIIGGEVFYHSRYSLYLTVNDNHIIGYHSLNIFCSLPVGGNFDMAEKLHGAEDGRWSRMPPRNLISVYCADFDFASTKTKGWTNELLPDFNSLVIGLPIHLRLFKPPPTDDGN